MKTKRLSVVGVSWYLRQEIWDEGFELCGETALLGEPVTFDRNRYEGSAAARLEGREFGSGPRESRQHQAGENFNRPRIPGESSPQ